MPSLADNNALSSGVTDRSRRRRKPKNDTPDDDDKENVAAVKQAVSTSSEGGESCQMPQQTKSKKRKPVTGKNAQKKEPTVASSSSCNYGTWTSSYETHNDALRRFRSALENVSKDEASLFSALDDRIIEASQSIPQERKQSGSLTLQEKSGEVLSAVRKIVKKATESQTMDSGLMTNLLYLALHGIRALGTITDEASQVDALFRLLYHVIATASTIIISTPNNTTKGGNATKLPEYRERSGFICLSAYETLGHLLLRYSVTSAGKPAVVFQTVEASSGSRTMFPVPVPADRKKSSSINGKMSLSQITTISTQSTIATAKVMMELASSADSAVLSSIWETLGNVSCSGDKSSSLSHDQKMIVHLIRTVSLKWVASSLEQALENQVAVNKEALSYGKQCHRALWDLASKLSKQKPEKSLPVGIASQCLELRQSAIAVLLLSDNGFPIAIIPHLREKYFDSACTQAWKAATSFAQLQQSIVPISSKDDHPLRRFHDDVGSVVDALACTTVAAESVPYVEYCAYRATHLGPTSESGSCNHSKSSKRSCYFANLPFLYIHQQTFCGTTTRGFPSNTSLSPLIALVFLSVQVQRHLLSLLNHEESHQGDYADDLVHMSLADYTIDAFANAFVDFQNAEDFKANIPASVRASCFKLLSSISLYSTVFQFLDKLSREKELIRRVCDGEIFQVASDILTKCVGPFCYLMVTSEESAADSKRIAYFWDIIIECYARGAVLSDMRRSLKNATENETSGDHSLCKEHADTMLSELYRHLTPEQQSATSPPSNATEKAAKLLASIGKQRFNRNEALYSLRPFMYSISLSMRMVAGNNDKSCGSSKKSGSGGLVAAKWSLLSSVFHSLGRQEEATVSMVASLQFETCFPTALAADNDFLVNATNFLAHQTKGVFITVQTPKRTSFQARGMFSRLISMISEAEFWDCQPLKALPKVSTTEIAKILIESVTIRDKSSAKSSFSEFFYESTGAVLNFVGLLKTAFLRGDQNVGWSMEVLTEILVSLGKKIQCCSGPGSRAPEILLKIHRQVVDVAVDLIHTLPITTNEPETVIPVLSAMVYVVAAVSLLSYSSAFDQVAIGIPFGGGNTGDELIKELVPFAEEFIEFAWNLVAEKEDSDIDLDCIVAALRSTIYLFRVQLSAWTKTVSENPEAFWDLITKRQWQALSSGTTHSGLIAMARLWTSFSLSRFRDRSCSQGHRLVAAYAALKHDKFLQNNIIDSNCHIIDVRWSKAVTSEMLFTGGLLDAAMNIENIDSNADDCCENIAQLEPPSLQVAEAERLVSSIRLRFCLSPASNLKKAENGLQGVMVALSALQESSIYLKLLVSRAKSSVYIALSEAAELQNDLSGSLSSLHMCFQSCQETLVFGQEICSADPEFPSWGLTLIASVIITTRERQSLCLRRTALLYGSVGDHRRSEAYSISALTVSGTGAEIGSRVTLHDLIRSFQSIPAASLQELIGRRLLFSVKASSSALDRVRTELGAIPCEDLFLFPHHERSCVTGSDYEQIQCLIAIGDALYGKTRVDHATDPYDRALEKYNTLVSSHLFQSLSQLSPHESLKTLHYQLILGENEAPLLLDCTVDDESNQKQLQKTCNQIIKSRVAPRSCRTAALYYLGLIELTRAREAGDLQKLWNRSSNATETNPPSNHRITATSKYLKHARKHFLDALTVAGPPSELRTRQLLRSLALVTGPETGAEFSAMSAGVLIHTSIGGAARQLVCNSLKSSLADSNEAYCIPQVFGALDVTFEKSSERTESVNNFFREMKSLAPPDWRYVACTLCPTGEILVSSLETDATDIGFTANTIVLFPVEAEVQRGSRPARQGQQAYENILEPLDAIITKSQQQLGGIMTSTDAAEKFGNDSAKRKWWRDRGMVDSALQRHIEDVETKYFSTDLARLVLAGDKCSVDSDSDSCSSDSSSSCSFTCGNLSSRFDAAMDLNKDDSTGSKSSNRPTRLERSSFPGYAHSSDERERFGCTFLVLDEDLHRFPFEGLALFVDKAVSRLPSLPFALDALRRGAMTNVEAAVIDPTQVSYILDPEANLSGTQQRVLPFIQELQARKGWEWQAVVGEPPSTDFVENSLKIDNGLLLYCGHGGGQSCFSRTQLDRLQRSENSAATCKARRCRAAVILMGCSSGKLESVNRKRTQSSGPLPLFFEPEGIALSYLMAGAPCVVGNLWDVTDHDIDRYCLSLLEMFFSATADSATSLPHCVARARSACKMQFIVGCAPVCYGIPVHLIPPHTNKP